MAGKMAVKVFMGLAAAQGDEERAPLAQAYNNEEDERKKVEGHPPSQPKMSFSFLREFRAVNPAMKTSDAQELSGEEEREVYEANATAWKEAHQKQMMEYDILPSRPKRPLHAYDIFWREYREANPGMAYADAQKLSGETWRAMAEEEKDSYKAKAASLKEACGEQLREDKNTYSKPFSKPKVPPKAYDLVVREVEEANPGTEHADVQRMASEKWRAMTPKEKEVYKAKAVSLKEAYQEQMVGSIREFLGLPRVSGLAAMRRQT